MQGSVQCAVCSASSTHWHRMPHSRPSLALGSSLCSASRSPQLKAQLNVTQGEIEMVGVIGGMSSYLSPLSGVIVHGASTHSGVTVGAR